MTVTNVQRRMAIALASMPLLWLLAAGCNGSTPAGPSPALTGRTLDVRDFVVSVSIDDGDTSMLTGPAPPPGGGPAVQASGNPNIINGGASTVTISGTLPFGRVHLFVGGSSLGLTSDGIGPVDGFYDLRLPSARTEVTLLVAFSQDIPADGFELLFTAVSLDGAVGPIARFATNVTHVGTGDIQIALSWDADSDVDLHVVDPGGEEIFYANPRSASGGELDLDSNAACEIDGIRNENVTWPTGQAPRGTYTVRVNYWSSCGVERTNYTVRIVQGGSVQVQTGFFTGPGNQGGQGSGAVVATFEHLTGPSPTAASAAAGHVPLADRQSSAKGLAYD